MKFSSDVQIWNFSLDVNTQAVMKYGRLLSQQEKQQAQRFRFDKHRRRFIVRRGILRSILAKYLDCQPTDILYRYNRYGKPLLEGGDQFLKFSSSHSEDIGGVAISQTANIGFDIEKVRPGADHLSVVNNQFCEEEKNWYRQIPDDQKNAAFYALWTCKEAYIKARGEGLSMALDSFCFQMDTVTIKLLRTETEMNRDLSWSFFQPEICSGYMSCLAVDDINSSYSSQHWSAEY